MPFKSSKQMRYMYAQHPEIAKRWSKEAKEAHKPQIVKSENKEHKTFKKK